MGMAKLRGGAAWVVAAVILAGCGASEPPPQAGTPPAAPAADPAPAAVPAPAPAPVLVEGAGSIEVAETALRAQRLFTPAGNNAFELFLLAMERDPGSQRVKDALTDLFPYAVLHVEQRTAARDADEARRVLDLMTRAQPTAPALERLDRELERLERRLATEAAQQQAAAARAAAPPPAPAPTPVAVQTPAPEPTPTPEQPAASAPVQQQAAPPAAQPVTTPPPAAAPVSAPAPAPAPARAPRVVRQPPLRYPDQAMRQGIEGSVTLDFQINADGSVSDVRVLAAVPQGVFEREAMSVVRRTRFEPPTEPTRARRTIEFNLNQ